MKAFYKNSILIVLAAAFSFVLAGSMTAQAATAPDLGSATSYGVFGKAGVANTGASTHIWGDVGADTMSTITGLIASQASGTIIAPAATVQTAITAAFGALNAWGADSGLDLAGTHTVTPGVYTVGASTLNGTLTLNGPGVYIFRSSSSITASAGAQVILTNGATPCNVFWAIPDSMTIGVGAHIEGTIITDTALISLGTNASLVGRALSSVSQVILDSNLITEPTCVASVPPSLTLDKIVVNNNNGTSSESAWTLTATGPTSISGPGAAGSVDVVSTSTFAAGTYTLSESAGPPGYAASAWSCVKNAGAPVGGSSITLVSGDTAVCTITNDDIPPVASFINVVKTVINDNGRTKVVGDFPLFVSSTPVVSGVTNAFAAGTYNISETTDPNYVQSFSGDCPGGVVSLNPGETKFCIITNNDIAPAGGNGGSYLQVVPPLIDVVKVPNPLALPGGPGPVTYTYTLRNIGTVPVTDITMVGDTCSPIVLTSGDTNADAKLDVNETWVYKCSTTLTQTHTNVVTATGWANGISAVDIASATVIVGAPVVPPLIHVTKVPSPLTLTAKGGLVTYTEQITNPGTVALSNVQLTDDKCSPMKYVSGDTNNDSKLDVTEIWTYTCQTNLTKTTTNTAMASGEANGLTVRDLAVATVVVAAPTLPNTGLPLAGGNIFWLVGLLGILILGLTLFIVVLRKRTI